MSFIVDEQSNDMLLKEYLKFNMKLSGRMIRLAAREERIFVNDKKVNLKYTLNSGDSIDILIGRDESQNIEPEKMDIDVVYEDEDIIVLNKQPGIVVHPTRSHPTGTIANGLTYYYKEKGENCIVRLVSRLDMDTSGLLLLAKNQFAHMSLARDMNLDSFQKEYVAVVHGNLINKIGTINEPIYRPLEDSIKRIVDARGQDSITHYEVVNSYKNGDVVGLKLETGRTHQIRVHLTHLGHPLFGDSLYCNYNDDDYILRQALHASKLTFPHPKTRELMKIEIDLPHDMKNLIELLKAGN
ncbi:MAG: pseudouridine synthase [Clostridiaceae bacterium]|nr:pseudouridine synthase [Clostridiaceae bacterium]